MPFWTCSIKKAEIFVVHVKRGTELKEYVLQNKVGKITLQSWKNVNLWYFQNQTCCLNFCKYWLNTAKKSCWCHFSTLTMIFPTLARLGFFKTNQSFVIRPFKQAASNFQDLCLTRCRFRYFIFSLQSSENYSQSLKKPENTKKHAIVKPFNQDGWQFYGHCGLILQSFLCSKLKLMKVVFPVHLPRQSAYSCTVLISSHDRDNGILQLHFKCTIRQRFAP